MKKQIFSSLLTFLLLISASVCYSQTFNFHPSEESSIVDGQYLSSVTLPTSITVHCNEWGFFYGGGSTFASWRHDHKFKSCTDYVIFKVDDQFRYSTHSALIDYTYRLTYQVIGYTNPADTVSSAYQVTNDDTLTISYNNSSVNQPYQNMNLKKYSGFYKMKIIIRGIYKDDGAGGLIAVDLTDPLARNFNIEGQIVTQVFDKEIYGIMGASMAPVLNATPNLSANYLDVSWTISSDPINPVNYELEWAFVDDYQINPSTGGSSVQSAGALTFDFKNNGTRVWLDNNNYKIPLTYPHGYLIYRVRPVRPDSQLYKYPVYGDWSCGLTDQGNVGGAQSVNSTHAVYQITNSYTNDSLNWQYTISFAEGGKFKHVGSFFDGLLKNRQSITRFNSDLSKLIVTNNVYDYEGRSAIKTLPAPTISPAFSYLHNVDINSVTGLPYQAHDFDYDPSACAFALIPSLSASSLASYYYSPLNIALDSLVRPWKKYIPDAEGYPFLHTIFEPGYNDRVKAQGGAGPKLQIGNGNYLSNTYVGAAQKKLNSLFGANIGWSSFYTMTVSQDANKQLSMSIKDYEGHQLATALLGQGPDSSNHAVITDNIPTSERFRQDLLLPAGPNQAIDTVNGTRTADADYFNEAQGDDSLMYQYSLTPYPVCGTQNVGVKAHLKAYITDECGNEIFNHETVLGNNGMVTAAPVNYSTVVGVFSANVAPYHVHKQVSYFPSDIDDATDSFMAHGSCFNTEENFIRSSVTVTPFPCSATENPDTDACAKMKYDMLQQLFPGAVYGQYSYNGSRLAGTDNSIFSPYNCLHDTVFYPAWWHFTNTKKCFHPHYDLDDTVFYRNTSGAHSERAGDFHSNFYMWDTCVAGTTYSARSKLLVKYRDLLDSMHGVFLTNANISGRIRVTTNSSDLSTESGDIYSAGVVVGNLVSSTIVASGVPWHNTVINILSTAISAGNINQTINGTLPSGHEIKIFITATATFTPTTFADSFLYTADSLGAINPNTCKYRYQDTCLVTLKDTITVGGYLYHHLKTMSADSFRMIYNAAIAEHNYSIAEALLPLHPQYCELQNCFVDSFKIKYQAISTWRAAQNLGMLTLDSLVAKDPLKSIMVSSGLYSSAAAIDSLKKYPGTGLRLDSLVLINAYCGSSDTVMQKECVAFMYNYQIGNHLLINDEVKNYYFNVLPGVYFSNRQNIINKIFMRGGTSCAHCAGQRMDLDTGSAVPPIPYDSDYTHYSDSSFFNPHAGWFSHISGLDTGTLHDSAIAFNYYIDTIIAHRSIDTIIAHLSNCIAGSTTTSNSIRNNLLAVYNSGAAPHGDFTAMQILSAITSAGVGTSDLCNPYMISATQFGTNQSTTNYDCSTPAYYRSVDTFLNDPLFLIAITDITPALIVLDTVHHNFHRQIARALGNNSNCYLTPSYNAVQKLYQINATTSSTSGAGDTVKFFLRCQGCTNFFGTTGSYVITTSCINTNPTLASSSGLVNEFSFVATVNRTTSPVATCTMLGWIDSIKTMGYSDNALSACVPCTQMKTLYKQFKDTLAHYSVYGADHPLYGVMLANFMNSKLSAHFTDGDYGRFITSCALADSLQIPLYNAGYSSYTFNTLSALNYFVTQLNAIDPSYDFSNSFKDSVSGALRIAVDLTTAPREKLWRYKNLLSTYGVYTARTVNQPFTLYAPSSGTEVGYIHYDPAFPFTPTDSSIIDTTYIKFRPMPSRGIWQGDHFVWKNCYNIVAVSGAPSYTLSRSIKALTNYLSDNYTCGAVFTPCYQHTINDDYYTTLKQSLLTYTYSLQQLPPYQVLDSLKPANLVVRIPAYSTYQPCYAPSPSDAGTFTNLYLSKPSMATRLYDTLQHIITLASSSAGYGYIFPNANATAMYTSLPIDLDIYRNSDGTYWYRYFTSGDSLFNVYISIPAYIPRSTRYLYHVVSVSLTPGDSLNRCFTVGIQKAGDPAIIYAGGRTDFVLSRNIKLDNTLMGVYGDSVTNPVDTFNNCERNNLLAAINTGIFNYNNYKDSIKRGVKSSLTAHLARNTRESLLLSYMNHEYKLTLYNYDRAGNLVYTVPPAGSTPITSTGTALDDVDTSRLNNTPAVSPMPSYNKINSYNYNSYDLVKEQTTIDGGKTRFFYDNSGRLVFSQNAKQATDGYYTYNIYDQQNRQIETGESQLGCPYFDAHTIAAPTFGGGGTSIPYCHYTYTTTVYVGGGFSMLAYLASPDPFIIYNINSVSYDSIVKFVRSHNRRDVVMTFYDTVAKKLENINGLEAQSNLRKRVSCVKYFETLTSLDKGYNTYSYATHYSYDMEGNVNTLVQDFPDLYSVKQQYKRVDYDYDVISGKVNMLSYNRGWPDQFYQRYGYDADNKLTDVNTSNDGIIWNHDASYYYYEHGPLARMELGDLTVQGVDYAYTIQGWIKSVNNDSLDARFDMGNDGTENSVLARDAVAYAIDYFKNDYKATSNNTLQHTTDVTHNMYNGNISRQTMAINEFQRLNKQYAYDQLNRIRNANYSSVSAIDNTLTGLTDYKNDYTYDADGNIQTLNRYGKSTSGVVPLMDSLIYMYTPGGTDNKLQSVLDISTDVTDNALTNFTDNTIQRYKYDPIGNTVKDLVSGQDTIRWNLYNKVKSTQNNAGGNTMQFRYDGGGNRVAKYFSVNTDSGTVQNNNYYVHDAQGNILATYKEKTRFTMEPITAILDAHRRLRSEAGGSENFNNLFITPEFANMAEFEEPVLKRSMENKDFYEAQTDHPASYYINSTGRIKDLVYTDPSYMPALLAADRQATEPLLGPAFTNYINNNGIDELVTALTLAFANRDLQQHTLGLLCNATKGDSTLWLIHKRYNDDLAATIASQLANQQGNPAGNYADSTGYSDSTSYTDTTSYVDTVLNCDTVLLQVINDNIESNDLATRSVKYAIETGAIDEWLRLASVDSLLYSDDGRGSGGGDSSVTVQVRLDERPTLGGSGRAMTALAMASLVNYEDGYGKLLSFFDTWEGGMALLGQIFAPDEMLRTVYNNDAAVYVNAFDAAFGDDAIDSTVAALPRLSYTSHLTTAAVDLGIGLPATLALVAVIKDKQFDLATHDMYGNNRLGVKSYYPRQVGLSYTQTGGFVDTARLWTKRPWYSLEYQDLINQDSLNLYGNPHKDVYYTQQTRGLKQYELTDHLGDVLVTLSDKRAMDKWQSLSAVDSILNYKPVVVTAYDYYPFGQYMPGRYTEDTNSYCFTTTLTEMTTVVTMVPLDFHTAGRMVNSGTTGAGPDVRPSDDGGILIHIDGGDAGTGTGVSVPIGTLGDGGDPVGPGDPTGPGGGTTPLEGDVLVTATVTDGVFNVSVTDDSTGKNLGNVLISSTNNTTIIKIHYSGEGGHSTSVHVVLDNSGLSDNTIRIETIKVPHYTNVAHSVVSRVCNGESYRYGFAKQYKDNEWAGLGNHYEFKYRGYNPLIGRFYGVDPLLKKYPWNSTYAYAENRVIDGGDLEGLEYYFGSDGTLLWKNSANTQVRLVSDEFVRTHDPTKPANLAELNQNSKDVGLTYAELNVRAFLSTIRQTEGQGKKLAYNTRFGMGTLKDLKDHPHNTATRWGKTSSAAGAYEILSGTWDATKAKLNLKDFEGTSQDAAAVQIIKDKKALDMVKNGEINNAFTKLKATWSSFPGGSEEGMKKEAANAAFKENVSSELKNTSDLATPQGALKIN